MSVLKKLLKARWSSSLIFLILLFLITGLANASFLSYSNIIACFNTATMYTLLAIGIAFVIMTGEIDVSIGAILGLSASVTGMIAQNGGSIGKMLVFVLLIGAAVGLFNGIGVSVFGVPSLIFTLGTNGVLRGIIYMVTEGRTIENFGGPVAVYGNMSVFAEISLYYMIALVLSVLWNFTLNRKFTFKSAANVPVAMLKVAAYYAVFTPLSSWLEHVYTMQWGWNEYLATAANMVLNLVTEFLYQRFFVFGNSLDTQEK